MQGLYCLTASVHKTHSGFLHAVADPIVIANSRSHGSMHGSCRHRLLTAVQWLSTSGTGHSHLKRTCLIDVGRDNCSATYTHSSQMSKSHAPGCCSRAACRRSVSYEMIST
eukprot:1161178-Pelagomonas_calceolata.AAC.8